MAGTLPLRGNTQAFARMLVLSALIGGTLIAVFAAAISARFGLGWFHPEHGGPGSGPWVAFGLLGALFSVALSWALVHLRQPRGAKLTWDDWGVTEWDGEGVRTSIPYTSMKARFMLTALAQGPGARGALQNAVAGAVLGQGDLPGGSVSGHLILTDDVGRRIDATQGTQPLLLNDRLSTVDEVLPLVQAVKHIPPSQAEQSPGSETLAVFGFLLGIAGYLFALLGLVGLAAQRTEPWPPFACVGAGVLLLLRSLPWLVRARRGRRPRQQRVEIVGGDEREVKLSGAQVVEVGAHPDAGLFLRKGEAWLDARGVLETTGARAARLARRRANLTMGLLRVLGAFLVGSLGVSGVIAVALEQSSGMDPRVQLVWRTKGPSAPGRALDAVGHRALVIEDGAPVVLDTDRGEVVQRLSSSRRCSITEGALSPGSHYALFSCDEDLAHLWSLEGTPKEVATIQAELSVSALTLGEDVAVVTDGYGACKVYSVPEGKLSRECSVRVDQAEVVVLAPASGAVAFISLYASAHKAWLSVGGQAKQLEAADGDGEALAFSADGALLAVANQYEVKLLDGRTGAELGKVDVAHAGGLAFSADGSKLAVSTGGEDAAVKFVDVASRRVTSSVPIRWKRGLFGFETDDAGALAFEGNESVLFLTKWRGVLLRASPQH